MVHATGVPMPLDVDDPDVRHAMGVVSRLPAEQRDEIVRTVYRFVLAYCRRPDTELLKTLVNSMVNSVQLWTDEEYARATAAAERTRRARPVSYDEAVDVIEEFGAGT